MERSHHLHHHHHPHPHHPHHPHSHSNGFIMPTPLSNHNLNTIRVVMFPWLAHGHITPFLELAKKLTTRNFVVYLCSTPVNLSPVRQNLGDKFSKSIHFVEIHLPSLPNLPPHYHTTNGLPPHLMTTLKEAFDMSAPTFAGILKTLSPDLLVYDFLQPWAATAALAQGILAVEFISSSASMTSLMCHVFSPDRQGTEYPFSSSIYFRDYELNLMKSMQKGAARRNKDDMRALDSLDLSSDIVLIKSFDEIEGKFCDYMSLLCSKKVLPVGPLVQDLVPSETCDEQSERIIEWLDGKEHGSTVFVSFGSEYFLSEEDRGEIAHGLELSMVNFVWVVRFPKGEQVDLEEKLPPGFYERVGGRGLVVEGWAPQARILQHHSIGGFVSHCGWNSVMEGMKFGVPIIAMPMHLDQPINARLVGEIGVGLEVVRDGKGKLQRDQIAKVINQVVNEKCGQGVREKAKQMSRRISSKGDEEIDDVVHHFVKLCINRKIKRNHQTTQ